MKDVDRLSNAYEIKIVQKVLSASMYVANRNAKMFAKINCVDRMLYAKL